VVKKLFTLFNKEIGGLHEAAYLLAFFAILSQVLGLVRDKLLAYSFGAGHILDLYYSAFRVPDLIFVSIASMVSTSVLVPFFIEKIDKDKVDGKKFVDGVFSVFLISILLVSLIVFFLVPYLIPILLPGFVNDSSIDELITLTRIILLSPIFLGLSNFLASITQMYNRFFIYALSPVFYNIGIILGTVFLYPIMGIQGLGVGVAIGAFMHFFIQVPFVIEKKLFPKFIKNIEWGSIKRIVLLSLPRTLTLSANHLATFFLIAAASLMEKGSISVFSFALSIQSVPLSVIGVSYSSAVFPTLTRLFSVGNREKFVAQMIVGAKHIIFWSTPIMVLFVVLRAQIVRTVLGAGQFSWSDTRLTAACLAIFIFSVIGQSLVLLFVRAYYSAGNTKKPLYINILSSLFIVLFGYLFMKAFYFYPSFRYFMESLFKVEDVSGSSVLMLPLAYTFGVIINTILHWIIFSKDFSSFSRPVFKTFFETMGASIIMGYVIYLFLNVFDDVFNLSTALGIFLQGFFSGIIGIIVFILILLCLKNKEIRDIWSTLHNKIWKAKVVPTEQQLL